MPQPAIEGWFTIEDQPHLIGTRCATCATVFFPPREGLCRNPSCSGREFDVIELSRRGRVWSYTDAQYQPPEPYLPPAGPYVPFAVAAVQLPAEGLVVLGQLSAGVTIGDVRVGTEVELVVEPMYEIDGVEHLTYRWKPVEDAAA